MIKQIMLIERRVYNLSNYNLPNYYKIEIT